MQNRVTSEHLNCNLSIFVLFQECFFLLFKKKAQLASVIIKLTMLPRISNQLFLLSLCLLSLYCVIAEYIHFPFFDYYRPTVAVTVADGNWHLKAGK